MSTHISSSSNQTLEKIQYFRQYKEGSLTMDELAERFYTIDNPQPNKFIKAVLFFPFLVFAFFIPRQDT
jgi:hypothetical protein